MGFTISKGRRLKNHPDLSPLTRNYLRSQAYPLTKVPSPPRTNASILLPPDAAAAAGDDVSFPPRVSQPDQALLYDLCLQGAVRALSARRRDDRGPTSRRQGRCWRRAARRDRSSWTSAVARKLPLIEGAVASAPGDVESHRWSVPSQLVRR